MRFMRLGNTVILLIATAAIVAFAPCAAACEDCPFDPNMDVSHCVSGLPSGSGYCYGGFGETCNLGGLCEPEEGGGGGGGGNHPPGPTPVPAPNAVAARPCLTCIDDKPRQGFMLVASTAASEETLATLSVTGYARRD